MSTPENTSATLADVHRAVRRYALGASAAFLLLVAASVYSANQANDASHQAKKAALSAARVSQGSREALVASGKVALITGCNRDFTTQSGFLSLLDYLDGRNAKAYAAGAIDLQTRRASREFYVFAATKWARVPDCREVENLLTADPNVPIPVIKPLYRK